jgi:hypothetical protein
MTTPPPTFSFFPRYGRPSSAPPTDSFHSFLTDITPSTKHNNKETINNNNNSVNNNSVNKSESNEQSDYDDPLGEALFGSSGLFPQVRQEAFRLREQRARLSAIELSLAQAQEQGRNPPPSWEYIGQMAQVLGAPGWAAEASVTGGDDGRRRIADWLLGKVREAAAQTGQATLSVTRVTRDAERADTRLKQAEDKIRHLETALASMEVAAREHEGRRMTESRAADEAASALRMAALQAKTQVKNLAHQLRQQEDELQAAKKRLAALVARDESRRASEEETYRRLVGRPLPRSGAGVAEQKLMHVVGLLERERAQWAEERAVLTHEAKVMASEIIAIEATLLGASSPSSALQTPSLSRLSSATNSYHQGTLSFSPQRAKRLN